jgi:hypothetical protein
LAVLSTLLVFLLGVPAPGAAQTVRDEPLPQATDSQKPPADTARPPAEKPPGNLPPAPSSAVPRLQLQDEGPETRSPDTAQRLHLQTAAASELEERPFWKTWVFWAVAGALVAGAVGMVIYTSSNTNSSIAPCPPDTVVSLGCFGAGR